MKTPRDLAEMFGVSPTARRLQLLKELCAGAFATCDHCIEWPHGRNVKRGGYGVAFGGWQAHRASLSIKLGRPLVHGEVARHTCDNPPCFNGHHLIIGTQADNQRDAIERGLRTIFVAPKGEAHHAARLTAPQVSFIRDLHEMGADRHVLAEKFHVTPNAISLILTHENWAHIL